MVVNVPINKHLETETLSYCPVCGKSKSKVVFKKPDGFIPLLHLQECLYCRSIYLNPRLASSSAGSLEDSSEVYSFSSDIAERKILELTGLICWLEDTCTDTSGRKLLDIGCSRGLLMEAARRREWIVTGVEPSARYANIARKYYGFPVYSGLSDIPEAERFDLIIAWHVLEHTFEPIDFLRVVANRLTRRGILAIQVPSFDYVDDYRERDQLWHLICSAHNFYFTYKNIRFVLNAAKLQIVYISNDPQNLRLTVVCTTHKRYPFLASLNKSFRYCLQWMK
jgi:2-polyprenyl-3-methyl-5-hydroxy-6-metoxy-1,4-benzoquinol methylase